MVMTLFNQIDKRMTRKLKYNQCYQYIQVADIEGIIGVKMGLQPPSLVAKLQP